MSSPLNPDTISLVDACITCISLPATNPIQEALQANCSEILDFIAGIEMLMDEDQLPDSFPEMEL